MRQLVVLKSSQPMRVANASFSIKQGQIAPHPGYPMPEEAFDIFDDTPEGRKKAIETAAKNVELKNTANRHGVTSMKTLAKLFAKEAKDAPTEADRKKAFEEAKLLTKEGLVDPKETQADDEIIDDKEEEIKELKAKIEMLEQKKEKVSTGAYLDQNTRTVVKRVKTAVGKKRLKKKDVEDIIQAEEKGQARKGVLEKLKNLAKNDAIFGKLFK